MWCDSHVRARWSWTIGPDSSPSLRIVGHVPAREREAMASVTYDLASRVYTPGARPAINQLDLRSPTASSSSSSGPPAAASRPRCACSPTSKRSAKAESSSAGRTSRTCPQGPRHRHGLPELRPLPPHVRLGEHGLRPEDRGRVQEERAERVHKAAEILDLVPYLDRKPKALSGGQRQRVAMGRAIVRSPRCS